MHRGCFRPALRRDLLRAGTNYGGAVKQKLVRETASPALATLGLVRGKKATTKRTELMLRNTSSSVGDESGSRS